MALGNLDVIHLTYILQGRILPCYCFAIKELHKEHPRTQADFRRKFFQSSKLAAYYGLLGGM